MLLRREWASRAHRCKPPLSVKSWSAGERRRQDGSIVRILAVGLWNRQWLPVETGGGGLTTGTGIEGRESRCPLVSTGQHWGPSADQTARASSDTGAAGCELTQVRAYLGTQIRGWSILVLLDVCLGAVVDLGSGSHRGPPNLDDQQSSLTLGPLGTSDLVACMRVRVHVREGVYAVMLPGTGPSFRAQHSFRCLCVA